MVGIVVGEDKEYQLRTDAVPEAGRLLESYLAGPEVTTTPETEGSEG